LDRFTLKCRPPVLAALCGVLFVLAAAHGEICANDPVPAATLLLPYFEVDLGQPAGATTLLSINNADAKAVLAHVTLWTDEAVPTLVFDIYLTGYDVQTINLRDLFAGQVPVTASLDRDPGDRVSPKGPLSQDTSFPGCGAFPYGMPALDSGRRDNLRLAHTGRNAPFYGGCLAANYGDALARGYVTVDVVNRWSTLDPTRPGYFTTVAGDRHVLWGSYAFVDPAKNSASGEELVHIESCPKPAVGNGAGRCPFAPTARTFYGRYAAVAGKDQREPLPTTFGTEVVLGGAFSGGTDFIVWRDVGPLPAALHGAHPCSAGPTFGPLTTRSVVAFDEQERAVELCRRDDNTDPPLGIPVTCFPLAAQRVHAGGNNVIADDPTPPFTFGWMYLNLQTEQAVGQAWVSVTLSAGADFGASADAIALDRGCDAVAPGGVLTP